MDERANILLVDDKPARLLTYEAILGSLGHNLVRAQSGEEALGKLLDMDVAAILLDVSMPGMDGFETAAMIRDHPRSAGTPIIFVTGVHLTDVDRLRGYEVGAADYVAVPVIPEILRGKVHVLVQLYQQGRELARLNDALIATNAELNAAHEQLKAENTRELRKLNGTLERANAQLTAEIGERKRAEDLLRDAARRKDEFLAILAHELRNPLSAMHNGVQLMQAPSVDPERLRWLRELLERQLKHLTRLIDDLLDASRITTGRVKLQREKLDVESLVRQSVEAARPMAAERRQELTMRLLGEPLYIEADQVRLTQVFGNLLTNSVKYTPDGGSITIAVERGPSEWAVIRVRDNGVGISADMLERVFELFAQADAAEARTHSGLGIGLSLVRALVELHGGTVHATSEGLGRGSEFIVRVPVANGAHEPAPSPDAGDVALAPLKLLIVDDNVDTATGLALDLRETARHIVRVEHSGRAGLAAVREFEPEIVLLDIGLPDMDGYEVACRLRQEQRFRTMPLIALTGFGGEAHRTRAEQAGFNDYLVKPVTRDVLMKVLAAQAPRASRERAAVEQPAPAAPTDG